MNKSAFLYLFCVMVHIGVKNHDGAARDFSLLV